MYDNTTTPDNEPFNAKTLTEATLFAAQAESDRRGIGYGAIYLRVLLTPSTLAALDSRYQTVFPTHSLEVFASFYNTVSDLDLERRRRRTGMAEPGGRTPRGCVRPSPVDFDVRRLPENVATDARPRATRASVDNNNRGPLSFFPRIVIS